MSITEHGVECAKGKTIFPRSRYHEALFPTLDRNLERFCQKNCSSSCFANTTFVAEVEMGVQKEINKENLIALSKLASKEVLVAQTISTIASPMYGLINTLEAKMQELIYILNTKAGGDTNG